LLLAVFVRLRSGTQHPMRSYWMLRPAPVLFSITATCCAWPAFFWSFCLELFLLNVIKRNHAGIYYINALSSCDLTTDQTKPTQGPPGSTPLPSGTCRSSEVDRRRPEATGGDRRRPEATGGNRGRPGRPEATGGDRGQPEASRGDRRPSPRETRPFRFRTRTTQQSAPWPNCHNNRATAAVTCRRLACQRRHHRHFHRQRRRGSTEENRGAAAEKRGEWGR